MSTKFFVFGGGRWREVCMESGTVSGWDNSVRFVYSRGRRLHVGRRRAVLAGLRALAAGVPTTVQNGPRLAQRRHGSHQRTRREVTPVPYRHCGQTKPKTSVKVTELPVTQVSAFKQTQTDDTLQMTTPALRTAQRNCKQTQVGSKPISYKFHKRSAGTKKILRKSRQSVIKYRHSSESNDTSAESSQSSLSSPTNHVRETVQRNHITNHVFNQKPASRKEIKGNSTSTDEPVANVPKTSNKTKNNGRTVRVHNKTPAQRKLNKLTSKSTNIIENFISKIIGGDQTSHLRGDNKQRGYTKHIIREKMCSQVFEHTSGTECSELSSGAHSFRIQHSTVKKDKKNNNCKELTIEESDIIALRGFLEKNSSQHVLLRFDSDDTYKQRIFYSINPLVRLELCPEIQELLGRREPDALLADFASQLGLRSVSARSGSAQRPPGYRTRRSLAPPAPHTDADKENLIHQRVNQRKRERRPASHLRTRTTRVLEEKSPEKVLEKEPKLQKVNSNVSSDSDNVFMKKSSPQNSRVQKSSPHKIEVKKQTVLQRTLKVSRRGYRSGVQEYSALEDQAIVSWVSQGARATRVNGNKLWRDLYEQYQALTGQKRTWQSLRNRYLRYVLPALGRLAVPERRAAALRAAAATGEIKSKKKPMRRNSIFDRTEVEAASARAPPRLLALRSPDHSDTESEPPSKRLRSSLAGRSARDAGAKRSRKLYNPNAVL